MSARSTIRLAVGVALGATLIASAGPPAAAQPAGTPPSGPPQVAGRVLNLEEAVNIALETQPQIQARLFDYAAARYRVDQAMSPLLPQITGSASAIKSQT